MSNTALQHATTDTRSRYVCSFNGKRKNTYINKFTVVGCNHCHVDFILTVEFVSEPVGVCMLDGLKFLPALIQMLAQVRLYCLTLLIKLFASGCQCSFRFSRLSLCVRNGEKRSRLETEGDTETEGQKEHNSK